MLLKITSLTVVAVAVLFIDFGFAGSSSKSSSSSSSSSSSDCDPCKKPHEVWAPCGVNACNNLTCDKPTPGPCPKICNKSAAGCVCKSGYVRNQKGDCILLSKCPSPCKKKYEVWQPCGANGCNNPTCRKPVVGEICTLICKIPGDCVCKPGTYRDECTGECVTSVKNCSPGSTKNPLQCPKCTKPHEIWVECGADCCNDPTCSRPNTSDVCTAGCAKKGDCVCKKGYFRDEFTGECVDDLCDCSPESLVIPNKCSTDNRCKKANEKYEECGRDCCNNPTCARPKVSDVCIPICKLLGECVCKPGFYRDEYTGECVDDLCDCSPESFEVEQECKD